MVRFGSHHRLTGAAILAAFAFALCLYGVALPAAEKSAPQAVDAFQQNMRLGRGVNIIGPGQWNNINALAQLDLPEDDRNLIVTVHYYSPFEFTHQGASWTNQRDKVGVRWEGTPQQREAIERDFEKAQVWAKQHNRPVLLGEFGAYDKADMDSRVRYIGFVTRQAEKLGWSWAYWQFDSDFILYDIPNKRWIEPIRDALIPPQPSRDSSGASPPLTLDRDANWLVIRGKHLPGGEIRINYLEAYCRDGSTDADWVEHTVVPHANKLVSLSADKKVLRLHDTLADGLTVEHTITAGSDEVDFRLAAHNPATHRSEAHWAQPCVRLGAFTGFSADFSKGDLNDYLPKCFVFLDGALTRLPTKDWATQARYTPGQVWCPAGVPRTDVNPRPLSKLVPSNGLIGCYSGDEKLIFATAWQPYQELFQGVARCLHSDFRLGGLAPGATLQIRGKIYLVPNDVPALLKRYAKDFPEHAAPGETTKETRPPTTKAPQSPRPESWRGGRTTGPLFPHPKNPRYFTDGSGKAIYLCGSHTWSNLQDQGAKDPPPKFDYDRYLDFLQKHNHNFIRLWAWEQARWAPWSDGKGQDPRDWFIEPNPYARTGPGLARDGKPKFDLTKFDQAYFDRLHERVSKAGERGIYVSIMLFQGWSSAKGWYGGTPWLGHPYHPDNNIQQFNGNLKSNDGPDLADPRVREQQAAYLRKVVDTVNALNNLLYEVTNEGGTKDWDWWVVRTVQQYEKTKRKQHPVGLTGHGSETNEEMLASPADWISPGSQGWPDLKSAPRPAPAAKVALLDTDHVFGTGGDQKWVWKSFLRGYNVLFMDPYDDPQWAPVLAHQNVGVREPDAPRRAMGLTRRYAERMDLAASAPRPDLASTGYCLACPGRDYLVYLPDGGEVKVDLTEANGKFFVEWAHPVTGRTTLGTNVDGGAWRSLKAPIDGDAVLYLRTAAWGVGGPVEPADSGPAEYFPSPESQGGWRRLESAEQVRRVAGMDPVKLAELKEWLLKSDGRDFAADVIRRGHVVLEVERGNSAKTDARRVASVSKAVCATVLSIASERSRQGLTPRKMSFDDPAFEFIPWAKPLSDPRKARITVKQLLNHTSGLCPEATGAPNEGTWGYVLGLSGDPRTAKLAFDPGTACGYSTHALDHAALVCETVTGKPYDQFAVESLFKPIGVERWWFEYFDGGEKIGRHPTHGLGMPARDLARIAYCMLRGGRWGDRQVIPKWFVNETASPTHNVQGLEMRFKLNAQTFSHAWELPARLTGENGRSGEGIPADARHKPGSGGQLIAFVPSLDLVVTRQTGSSGEWQFEEYLRRACAAVLPEGKSAP